MGVIKNNNGLRINSDYTAYVWTFTLNDKYGWSIFNKNESRYLSTYDNNNPSNWRTYTSIGTNQSGKFRLFKKQ